ncbi:Gfo/Idh/MocA family oxidoreductase [Cytobacillus sp. IB215665]|uniref:Gfo/Idh/MocA family protein n=1 Tax=Cytobacillus sp. IB215665 TaxID=3097357 RepID=UPI002A15E06E|nr:Gfo/Idh/MocA family oxidoreductase [Cytobacillus sp. IB215665]MDX8365770.1 Gfo/Idh/MocA family oxidoreductase [Cytobacillus sp. IB215665]
MYKKIRWGILSTANIAQTAIIPAIHKANNAEVVAISSANDRVKSVAESLSIPNVYKSYQDLLLDSNVDAVYIPLPNGLHAEWVKEAATHGKHILCEKPAALNSSEMKDIIDTCRKNNVIFMEAFMYQFHPQHKRVKEIIASDEIGDIKLMRSSFSFTLNDLEGNIRMVPKLGGGSLYDVGSYCINAIQYILDSEPIEVFAQAHIHEEYHVDMSTYALIKLQNGVMVSFDCSFERSFSAYYEMVGTKGKLVLPRAFTPNLYNNVGKIIVSNEQEESRVEYYEADQYVLQIEHFSNCILNKSQPMYTGEQSLKNMKVIDACFQSITAGEKVNIS